MAMSGLWFTIPIVVILLAPMVVLPVVVSPDDVSGNNKHRLQTYR